MKSIDIFSFSPAHFSQAAIFLASSFVLSGWFLSVGLLFCLVSQAPVFVGFLPNASIFQASERQFLPTAFALRKK
jgi:hypothetical protein